MSYMIGGFALTLLGVILIIIIGLNTPAKKRSSENDETDITCAGFSQSLHVNDQEHHS